MSAGLSLSLLLNLPSKCRVICEIEATLKKGASTPRINYNSDKIEGCKLEIREILSALNVLGSPPGDKFDVGERAPYSAAFDFQDTATTLVSESGTSLPSPLPGLYGILAAPCYVTFLNFDTSACERLIRRTFALHELPSLIEAILSKGANDTIHRLLRDDAQTFADVINEARSTSAYRHKSVDTN